jgi:hypothetical protein
MYLTPQEFTSLPLTIKRTYFSNLQLECSDDQRCHQSFNKAHEEQFVNSKLSNVQGMTTIELKNGVRVVILGEKHYKVAPETVPIGSLIKYLQIKCSDNLDVFVEDTFTSRTKTQGRGGHIPQVTSESDSLDTLYNRMYKHSDCGKVRFHAVDLRSSGIIQLIFYLENQFKEGIEAFALLDIVLEVVLNDFQLAKKIYHKQLRHIGDIEIVQLEHSIDEWSEIWIKQAEVEAQKGNWRECISWMNHLVDHTINVYALLRAARNDFDSKIRLIYMGELHRLQINEMLQQSSVKYSVSEEDTLITVNRVLTTVEVRTSK